MSYFSYICEILKLTIIVCNFKYSIFQFNYMLLPAEIESKTMIPALRAILAKKLADQHKIREDEISKMLGVTQAAVSNYIRGTRGDPELISKLSSHPLGRDARPCWIKPTLKRRVLS